MDSSQNTVLSSLCKDFDFLVFGFEMVFVCFLGLAFAFAAALTAFLGG